MVQAHLVNYTPIADRLFRLCPSCCEECIREGKGLQKWLLDKRTPRAVETQVPVPAPRAELGPIPWLKGLDVRVAVAPAFCGSLHRCGCCKGEAQCSRDNPHTGACQGTCSSCEALSCWVAPTC